MRYFFHVFVGHIHDIDHDGTDLDSLNDALCYANRVAHEIASDSDSPNISVIIAPSAKPVFNSWQLNPEDSVQGWCADKTHRAIHVVYPVMSPDEGWR